jgi:hypothetical protein
MRKILTLVLAAGLFAALPPTHSQQARTVRDAAGFRSTDPAIEEKSETIERAAPRRGGPILVPKQCVIHSITCGQTVTANLSTADCELDDGSFVDFYLFFGQAGRTVTINLGSTAFDTFLALLDPVQQVVAVDDDSGPGTDSRIVFTLDQTSSEWAIAANSVFPAETGPYTLSLQCSGTPPPPPGPTCPTGFFPDANYPDFCFRVNIGSPGSTIPGKREPACIDETVCVSGALAGRSEAFLRILGPRPNGFLWPTIVRFTPSRVVVDMHQLSSGDTNTYVLPAVPPGVDDLSGLQDRTGFLP